MSAFDKIPGVYFTDIVESEPVKDGSKIPIFIGVTGNSTSAEGILKFVSYDEAKKTVANGGIGPEGNNNLLLKVIKEFYEENAKAGEGSIRVPYIYAIDLGTDLTDFATACADAKKKLDADVEVFVLPEQAAGTISAITTAATSIATYVEDRILRFGLFTDFSDNTDSKMIARVEANEQPYMAYIEPTLYGKTVARICKTPFNKEPGFYQYDTVDAGTFTERSMAEMLALQNGGVIFNRDEYANKKFIPRINLGVFTTFIETTKPADCLIHARSIANQVIGECFDVCFAQVKNNETETNLAYIQSQLDRVISKHVNGGNLRSGKIIVRESVDDPYALNIAGEVTPVNSNIAINVQVAVKGGI